MNNFVNEPLTLKNWSELAVLARRVAPKISRNQIVTSLYLPSSVLTFGAAYHSTTATRRRCLI